MAILGTGMARESLTTPQRLEASQRMNMLKEFLHATRSMIFAILSGTYIFTLICYEINAFSTEYSLQFHNKFIEILFGPIFSAISLLFFFFFALFLVPPFAIPAALLLRLLPRRAMSWVIASGGVCGLCVILLLGHLLKMDVRNGGYLFLGAGLVAGAVGGATYKYFLDHPSVAGKA